MEAVAAVLSSVALITGAAGASQADSSATVVLSPRGSDAGACTREEPCASLDRGYRAVRPGGTVVLLGGVYPGQTLKRDSAKPSSRPIEFRPSAGATVVLSGRLTLDGVQNVAITGINFRTRDPHWDLLVNPCTRNVTLRGAVGRRFHINEGTAKIRILGGAWGGYGSPGEQDSSIGTTGASGPTARCEGRLAPPARDILLDGVTFHDVFWKVPKPNWGGAHPDCFEVNGYVDGVVIRNARFERCGDSFFAVYTDQGDSLNVTVAKTTFFGLGDYAYYGIQMGNSRGRACGNIVFWNNVYWPDNPKSTGYPFSPIHTTCRSGTRPTQVTHNIFQQAPRAYDCETYLRDPYRTVWAANIFAGGRCGSRSVVPLGYRIAAGRLVPDGRAVLVRRAFTLAARGLRPASIARAMSNTGWTAGRVRRILTNRVYLGGRYGSPGMHAPLVSRRLWRRAQRVL